MSRNIVRKSDYGTPPARMSSGAPPSLPVRRGLFLIVVGRCQLITVVNQF